MKDQNTFHVLVALHIAIFDPSTSPLKKGGQWK